MSLEGVSIFCFAASYAVALLLEGAALFRPGLRLPAQLFAGAGVVAQLIFIGVHGLNLGSGPNSLIFLSCVLAIFYLYGSFHHRRQAWGIFVLPVVLGLVLVAWLVPNLFDVATPTALAERQAAWAWLHATCLVLGAVGLCVSFVASVMYLVQSWRLRHKVAPGDGLQLLSLERLETMNRRGIALAFPLFTAGLLIGLGLLLSAGGLSWHDPKVLSTAALWLVFVVLLYLRYGLHLRGRRVALWTIAAFALLLLAFVVNFVLPSGHHFGGAS